MKKIFSMILIAAVAITSCNKDNKDGKNENELPVKHTSICSVYTVGQVENLDSLEYDSHGHISKVLNFLVEEDEKILSEYSTFTYSEDKIQVKSYVLPDGKTMPGELVKEVTYSIDKNGYVVSAGDKSFSYDSKGHLVKSGSLEFTWEGDELTGTSSGYSYTMSDVENPGYWPEEENLEGINPWLYWKGCFGKLSKHLPEALQKSGDVSCNISCEYEVEDGRLTGCSKTVTRTTGLTPSISQFNSTINWKSY